MNRLISAFKSGYKKWKLEFWVCIAAILISLGFLSNIPFGSDGYSDESVFLNGVLISIAAATAIVIRYGAGKSFFRKKEDSKAEQGRPFAYLIWFLPLVVTLVALPWLLTGALSDNETSVGMSIVFWLLMAHVSMLLGILIVPFIIVPLEMIGRGIIHLIKGNRKAGLPILKFGIYFAGFTAFCILGAMSTDVGLVGEAGETAILAALFGLPGDYKVTNEGLLWVVRIIGLTLLAVTFANLKEIRSKLNPEGL